MQVETRLTNQAMDCQFFGAAERQLFGIYEAPSGGPQRRCAVVLCYPFSREYLRCHRAYRLLAQRLSGAGFPVLRFDYYGFGDSAGRSEEGTIDGWIEDIATAAQEAMGKSARSQVCLVGLRLGASLAARAAARLDQARYLTLWEPVTSGPDYLQELAVLHQTLMRAPQVKSLEELRSGDEGLLGFPLTAELLAGLQDIRLDPPLPKLADWALVIENAENSDRSNLDGLAGSLSDAGVQCQYQNLPGPAIWQDDEQALVPVNVIQAIVAWLAEAVTGTATGTVTGTVTGAATGTAEEETTWTTI